MPAEREPKRAASIVARSAPAGTQGQPFAARLHFIPRAMGPVQGGIVRLFRRYFEQAPGWVLLTTVGRKTGLPREVLLPCERTHDALIVISTYGSRSDWMRNLRREPRVRVTCAGWVLTARAEVVVDLAERRAIVTAHPFFVPAPFALLNFLHRTVLRPLWIPFLRWWVTNRPVVVIRPEGGDAGRKAAGAALASDAVSGGSALGERGRAGTAIASTAATEAEALVAAVKAGDRASIERVLERNLGLASLRDPSGVSLVCLAVYHRQDEIARLIAARREALDVFEASALGDGPRVAELVRARPDLVDAVSPDGFHPLGYACFFGRVPVFDVLLEQGADLEAPARNAMRVRPLHSAVAHSDAAVARLLVRRLLEAGASPSPVQQNGFTPLHEAALRGDPELVDLLLARGADRRALNADGKTPADLAREQGHSAIAERLRA